MKPFSKKILTLLTAGAIAVNSVVFYSFITTAADGATKYEFENGKTTGGAAVQDSSTNRYQEGASGDKFVFLESGGDTASVTVPVETTGMYNITIHLSAPFGDKTNTLLVNDVDQGNFSVEGNDAGVWTDVAFNAVKLNAGDNTITVKGSWGWIDLDYLTVESATMPEISASQITCSDTNATAETQNLMSYLASVYGEHVISGQQEIYKYGPHDFSYEFDYIKDTTGKLPAIRGFDYLNCNPLYGSEDGTTDRIIEWVNNNPYADNHGIATASWHITVPKNFSSYNLGDSVAWADATYVPKDTDFEPSKILEEGTKEREYYMLCLKGLASELTKLQDANVPLIFRPLHEAEGSGGENGSWFWWGKEGSAVYKQLWVLTYQTLTEEYGLHNLIWEWNSYNYATSENWYPGDEYVDLIAYDKYNCTNWSTGSAVLEHNDSAISSTFYGIMQKYDSKKMVAMSENDSIPTLENMTSEKAGWLYFCPWYDGGSPDTNFLTNELFNKKEDLIEMYQSDYCITLDELPDDLYTNGQPIVTKPTTTQDPSKTTTTKPTTTTAPAVKGDPATIKKGTNGWTISFDRAIEDTVILDLKADSSVSYANGCVGLSTTVDDVDYWLSFKWEIKKSGEVTVNLSNPEEVSYNKGTDKVKDKDLIEKIVKEAQKNTSAEVQVWWANDGGGKGVSTSLVELVNAYLPKKSTSSETTTTTETTPAVTESETETSTTTTTASDIDTVTSTTTTAVSTTIVDPITTTTTTTGAVDPSSILYGDITLDGKIDLVDAVMLNKAVADQVTLSDAAKLNADCQADGEINGNDSITLLRFLVKLENSLPVLPVS